MIENRCDIIIPSFGALNYTTECVASVIKYTDYPYKIIIVDDGSDAYVREKLSRYEKEYPQIKLLCNDRNLGFIKSVNRGLKESSGKYAILLNNDTYVTPGWLSRMVRCAESDAQIGIVNPISNMAVNLSVQMPPGFNILTMSKTIDEISKRSYPDVVTGVGFCFMIKRELIDKIGVFDEIYGMGYCEESDYCMRALKTGYRVVAADDAFVYHKGFSSFGYWLDRYYKNRKIFDTRWADFYKEVYKRFIKINPLNYLRSALMQDLKVPKFEAKPVKELFYMTVNAWRRSGIRGIFEKFPTVPGRLIGATKKMGHQIKQSKGIIEDPAAKQNFYVTAKYMAKLPEGEGIKIAFLVYHLDVSGGLISILQLANQFITLGHTAYIVSLSEEPDPGIFRMYTRPIRFKNESEMADYFPKADIVIATYWPTAYRWIPKIKEKHPSVKSLYFIQDFESWFYSERETKKRQMVLDSYACCDYRIVKSQWLQNKLSEIGHNSHKIHLGLDLEAFYPREKKNDTRKKRILLQARPFEKRRGFENAVKVFKMLSDGRNDIEIVFFGCKDSEMKRLKMPFTYTNAGIVYDLNKTAELYSSSDILLDPSLFQGFGRPGIEAMACGTPTVLTKEGGITEYAQDGVNTLLVDPKDINGMANAITRLLDDGTLRNKLIENGLKTASQFSHKNEAKAHLEFYNTILGKSVKI